MTNHDPAFVRSPGEIFNPEHRITAAEAFVAYRDALPTARDGGLTIWAVWALDCALEALESLSADPDATGADFSAALAEIMAARDRALEGSFDD